MNIIINTYGSRAYFIKPGASLNSGGNDYFCPGEINSITAVPFIWVRAEKSGKCVNEKFAPKYYTKGGYGVRLIVNSLINESPESWYIANSLDNSTYLSSPIELKDHSSEDFSPINKIIENISKYTSFNTGDIIAYDLMPVNEAITPQQEKIIYKDITINIL